MTGEEIVAKLGEPEHKGEVFAEPATGETLQAWSYESRGIKLEMSGLGEGEQVKLYRAILKAPAKLGTLGGLQVGMGRDEAIAILKDIKGEEGQLHADESGAGVLWEPIWVNLGIEFDDGKVSQIYLGPGPE